MKLPFKAKISDLENLLLNFVSEAFIQQYIILPITFFFVYCKNSFFIKIINVLHRLFIKFSRSSFLFYSLCQNINFLTYRQVFSQFFSFFIVFFFFLSYIALSYIAFILPYVHFFFFSSLCMLQMVLSLSFSMDFFSTSSGKNLYFLLGKIFMLAIEISIILQDSFLTFDCGTLPSQFLVLLFFVLQRTLYLP